MSSPAPLVLLSGVDGSRASALAATTFAAARAESLSALLVGSADALPNALVAQLGGAIGALLDGIGADPVPASLWAALPGMRLLGVLDRARLAAAEPGVDVVLVDVGDLRSATDLVGLPALASRLLTSALTPAMAMRRDARRPDDTSSPFPGLEAARDAVAALADLLARDGTSVRLATTAAPADVARVIESAGVLAMLGVAVDGVAVVPAPHLDGNESAAGAERAAQVARIAAALAGVAVWKSPDRPRPVPKGRSVLGPLSHAGSTSRLDASTLRVVTTDEEFGLEVPLLGDAARTAAVGTCGEALVVEYAGTQRWLPLPPVLLRCRPTQAVRTPEGLRVWFAPEVDRWPDVLRAAAS